MKQITGQKLQDRKTQIGLVGTVLEITDDLAGNCFSASIQHDFIKIRLDYQKDLDLVPDEPTEYFCRKTQIDDPELKIGIDLLTHECGHRELPVRTTHGCPYDVETHDKIKSEIARALKEKGKQSQVDYVTNAFEDIFDNINCRNQTDFSGQTLFWNNQGLTRSKNGKYNPFYEAFVRINLFLGKEVKSYNLLSRFFSRDRRVLPAVKGFLEDLCHKTRESSPIRFNEKQGFQRLFTSDLNQRTKLWQELAYSFALRTADLLEETPPEQMFGHGENGGENSFDKEMQDPKIQEKLAIGRYRSKEGPSYHVDLQDQLYSLYKATSREIRIETSSFTASQSMPIVYFGKRFVSENDTRIRFRGIGFDSQGKLAIKTERHHIDSPVSYKTNPTQFPNLKIAIMDRSGSMGFNPDNEHDSGKPINIGDTSFIPWGDNSKYHFALKGYFGIDNDFESQGVSPFIDCSVLGLSGESIIKGKSREVAKKLLHSPKGIHTKLNASQLEKELNESALLVSISDGDVEMPKDTSTLDAKLRNCDYVHIQIGNRTPYSDHVQDLGKPVIFVKGNDDLSRAVVSFVSNYYHQKGQEAIR